MESRIISISSTVKKLGNFWDDLGAWRSNVGLFFVYPSELKKLWNVLIDEIFLFTEFAERPLSFRYRIYDQCEISDHYGKILINHS